MTRSIHTLTDTLHVASHQASEQAHAVLMHHTHTRPHSHHASNRPLTLPRIPRDHHTHSCNVDANQVHNKVLVNVQVKTVDVTQCSKEQDYDLGMKLQYS